MLSAELSAEHGQWDTSKAEYEREPMDEMVNPLIEEITIMKSVRSGGSQIMDNALGYFIDQDPGPMLVIQPGLNEAKTWSKDHFDTMVRDTPPLRTKVHSDKVKDRKNEILHKTFPGGMLYIIGANSAAGFRQKTIQRALLDDVDGYPVSAGKEGNPIELARNRTITYAFHHRLIVKISNPTTRGLSLIEQEFFASDQRHYFLPCPHCGFFQFLRFSKDRSQFAHLSAGYLKFDKDNLSWIYYECENCRQPIEERHKLSMVRAGRWVKQNAGVIHHAGFHISEMHSPFSTWELMVKDFLKAKGSREKLRVFVNQRLAETFEEDQSLEVAEDSLLRRAETYPAEVPKDVLVLTAGIDVQDDRLEVVVQGWGSMFRNWHIDRRVIDGSPRDRTTFDRLEEYLGRSWKHETGLELRPWTTHGLNAVCIDSGFAAEDVYRWVKRNKHRRVYATKGDDGFRKPIIISRGHDKRFRARLVIVGVDSAKRRLFDRLAQQIDKDGNKPPGYYHFNDHCGQEFFNQLTAEKLITLRDKASGFYKHKWVLKEGRRNEVLDCAVLNIAAIELLDPNFEALQGRLDERAALGSDGPAAPTAEPKRPAPAPRRARKRMRISL